MVMKKRGQMKIQQTAFMLVAVTLFFVLAGLFVFVLRFSNLQATSRIVEEENAMLLVTKLANSPEFACGNSFGNSRVSCVDGEKVMALKENIADYRNFWGVAGIEIKQVYPNSGVLEIYSKEVNKLPASSNFISLCWKKDSDSGVYAECELARLIIRAEDKT